MFHFSLVSMGKRDPSSERDYRNLHYGFSTPIYLSDTTVFEQGTDR